ncbi:Alpha-L-fucosidase, partial [Rhizoctonia solani]
MRLKPPGYLCFLLAASQCCLAKSASTFVDLSPHFNNKAASVKVNGTGNSDLAGGSYVSEFLPKGIFTYRGVDFNLPPFHNETALDNVRVAAQVVSVPPGRYHAVHALLAAEKNNIGQGNITVNYTDGTSITIGVVAPAYFQTNNPSNGPIWTPYHYASTTVLTPEGINRNETWIFDFQAGLDNSRTVESIQLPAAKTPIMHFFALTLYGPPPSQTPNEPVLNVQYARSTTKWAQSNYSANAIPDPTSQIFEVALDNLAPMDAPTSTWLNGNYSVVIEGEGLKTSRPYALKRLRSGDQVVMKIGVHNTFKAPTKTKGQIVVKDARGEDEFRSEEYEFMVGIPDYEPVDASLSQHEASDWEQFDEAKFGIFGVYSVPAWSDGKTYAESYVWIQHKINSSTWTRHREVYGENVVYDDFIANFTASQWNPDEWTDLFANSGAKYFTIVSKHHDGFALYDTKNTSNRNSLLYGPNSSIRERFHPFAQMNTDPVGIYQFPYGFGSWPGGLAHFAYNDTCCEGYEGYVKIRFGTSLNPLNMINSSRGNPFDPDPLNMINDWVQDLQKPQMETLFYDYEVDAIWCDIGGPSPFDEIAADWYNWAKKEYFTLNSYQVRKWESNSGLDPHFYGYNSGTAPDRYMKGVDVIKQLVDIVSKGGNYLLDVGPTATGEIIPEMTTPLLQAGQWLSHSGPAIYSTRYWSVGPADTTYNLRFTTTPEAFYIIALSRPQGGILKTLMPIPILEGDEVRLLGGSGKKLEWTRQGEEDGVVVQVGEEEIGLVEYAWAFKVEYKS